MKLKLIIAVCAIVLLALSLMFMGDGRQAVTIPGPKAAFYSRLGFWAIYHGQPTVGSTFLAWAETAETKYLAVAIRSGKLAAVTFHDYGSMGGPEFANRAWHLARSKGCRVLTVRQIIPSANPAVFEVLVDPEGKEEMQRFVNGLEATNTGSVYE